MKRNFRIFHSWLLIIVMIASSLVMQIPFAKPAYAGSAEENGYADSLTKVMDYYQTNNYSNATTWWDMIGIWGAGDSHKISWDTSQTSLYGNILGLLAKGEDPRAANGQDFVLELKATQDSSGAFPGTLGDSSSDQTWAIVALDAAKADYDQDKAIANLLTYQNPDGGFCYSSDYNTSSPDQSGMALLALADHQTVVGVSEAIAKVKVYLMESQTDTGGFGYEDKSADDYEETVNPNSIATVISGLVAVGDDPLGENWQKNGETMLDALLSFQLEDGSFDTPYTPGKADAMATYQSLIALGDLKAQESVWQRLRDSAPQGNSDSSITPLTATFDKNTENQADVPVSLTLNGNSLTSITQNGTALTAGSDYRVAVDSSTVTIAKEYLAEQATGTISLKFNFSSGNPQTLQLTISDSTSTGGGDSTQPDEEKVTLKVVGRNGDAILPKTTMSLEEHDTPYSVLVRALGSDQVTVSGSGSSVYVTGIKGTKAGADGSSSGWMYSINDDYPKVGAASITLKDGDAVAWRYTTNLGEDVGDDDDSTGSGSGLNTGTTTGTSTPTGSTAQESYQQKNQELLDELKTATAQQQEAAGLPENTPPVSPTAAETTVLRATDGVQLTVPPGAVGNLSAPVKFTVEIGQVTTPPKADTGALVINPLKYQRQFKLEDSAGRALDESTQFRAPVELTFPVVDEDLPSGITVRQLAIYWWDTAKGDWVKLGGVYNGAAKTISVPTYHLSTYAVMADTTAVPQRLAGSDRFLTADAVAEQGWKAGADNVVVVNAYAFSDALAAVPLAFKLNAPILLTEQETLTPATLAEIQKLAPKRIDLIGGTAVISQTIQAELENIYGAGNVERYAGADSYSTAALIAAGLGTTGKAIIANGGQDSYTDALAISSYASYQGIPILFTDRTALPESTVQALATLKVSSTIVVGGSYVIPDKIMAQLPGAVRYAGSDRYETATTIAQELNLNRDQVYVVTGLDFADALTAGNLAAHSFSPVLMVDTGLPETTLDFLTAHKGSDLIIVGGEGIISTDQENKLRATIP